MSKSKTVLEMTAAGLDAPWETTTPLMHSSCMTAWSSLVYSVLMRCLRSSRSIKRRTRPSLAVCPTHCSQLDLNLANVEVTTHNWGGMNSELSFMRKQHFLMSSQLRHHYVLSCKYRWDFFLQFFSHPECQDDSCQKLWKVALICQSYGQNTIGPVFRTRCRTSSVYATAGLVFFGYW